MVIAIIVEEWPDGKEWKDDSAEKKLKIAYEDGSKTKKWGEFSTKEDETGINQRVWMLPNKGKVFLEILENPYDNQGEITDYQFPSKSNEKYQTFCGT